MGQMQKIAKRLIEAGYQRERAVLLVTKTYKLSMREMELLHFALMKVG